MPVPDPIFPDAVENLDAATAQANLDAAHTNTAAAEAAYNGWQQAAQAWADTLGDVLATESGWVKGDYFTVKTEKGDNKKTYVVQQLNGVTDDDGAPSLKIIGRPVNKDGSEAKRGGPVELSVDQCKKVDGP